MAKTLQRKFMFASMLAVTILLVTLVGAINIMNCCAVINRQKVMLEMLCERDGRPEGPGRLREMDAEKDGTEQGPFFGTEDSTGDGHMSPDSGGQQEGMPEKSRTEKHGLFQRAMTMDEALAIRFFAVWYDEEGKIILTDCSHIYAVTEEGAQEMAQSILSLVKSTGVYQGFRYMYMDRDSFASGSREQDIQTGTGLEEARFEKRCLRHTGGHGHFRGQREYAADPRNLGTDRGTLLAGHAAAGTYTGKTRHRAYSHEYRAAETVCHRCGP